MFKNHIFISLSILLILSSCSGYFSSSPFSEDQEARDLALVGGGNLSATHFNDITPFVFKNLDGDKFLFFASDRPIAGETNQSYDIWVSRMIGAKFTPPITLSNMTSPWDEVNPVVFEQGGLYYLILMGGTEQTAAVFELTFSNKITVNYLSDIENTSNHNLILLERNGKDVLLITSATNTAMEYFFDGTEWKPARSRYFSSPVGKGFGFGSTPSLIPGLSEWYIFEQYDGQHWQINKAFVNTDFTLSPIVSGFFPLPEYGSFTMFNDRTPFVDTEDARVYFASDRYLLNGKYDLYRYNDKTFSQQISYGGYEYYPLPAGVYVKENAPPSGNGLSPQSPLPSIPEAILTARAQGLTNIYVTSGTYTPSNLGLEATGSLAGITITNAPLRLVGGFDSSFVKRSGISTLDAQGINMVVVVSNLSGFYMDGFRISQAFRSGGAGGGIYLDNVDNSLIFNTQIVFNTNDGIGGGAGIYISGNNNIVDAYIAHNYSTSGEGAGVYIAPGVTGLSLFGHIINNHSDNRAGGIYIYDGPGNYFSAVISNNTGSSPLVVGGILFGNSPPALTNCLLTNNPGGDLQSGV